MYILSSQCDAHQIVDITRDQKHGILSNLRFYHNPTCICDCQNGMSHWHEVMMALVSGTTGARNRECSVFGSSTCSSLSINLMILRDNDCAQSVAVLNNNIATRRPPMCLCVCVCVCVCLLTSCICSHFGTHSPASLGVVKS